MKVLDTPKVIFKALNIVFSKVITVLNFDKIHFVRSWILNSVNRTLGNIDRIAGS